jgi:hypothetical protein
MNKKRSNKGVALVELAMVMLLLALFGITIFTLIITGADTQARIIREKDAQAEARVALSYISVRLRQNDSEGKISVEPVELTGQNAIVIQERTFDYEYDIWIYSHNGRLYECLTDPGQQPQELLGIPIIEIERLETELDGGVITNTVYYYYDGELNQLSSTIYLRSH